MLAVHWWSIHLLNSLQSEFFTIDRSAYILIQRCWLRKKTWTMIRTSKHASGRFIYFRLFNPSNFNIIIYIYIKFYIPIHTFPFSLSSVINPLDFICSIKQCFFRNDWRNFVNFVCLWCRPGTGKIFYRSTYTHL